MAHRNLPIIASPNEVRINLISRYDNINPDDIPMISRLGDTAISELINIKRVASCNEYSTLSLKPPILSYKGDGWQTVELPVDESDYPFANERVALTERIDNVLDEPGSTWYPEIPALQVVEFKADEATSQAILEFVSEQAPLQTEVFDASLRFRPPVS